MFYVRETYPDVFERITTDLAVGEGDAAITHPVGNLVLYSDAELAAIGVIAVQFARLPLDHYEIARSIQRIDGVVTEVIDSAPSPVQVPASVTSAQAVIALKRAGLLAGVTAALNARDDEEALIWFTRAQTWERANSNVLALAQLLGLSEAQVDDLFVAAATIQ